jgi:tetratricopeptide (TPR) repeat protein
MSFKICEQYVLDAEKAFEQGLYLEGQSYLENALAEEPTFGKAHNHLGWFYLCHMKDYEQAETHLKLALKYAGQYSAPYIHMIDLLFNAKRLDEHEKLIAKAMYVPGVDKSFLYNEMARNREVSGKIKDALKFYRLAIRWSMENKEIEVIRENIRRAKSKRWLSVNI